jgi:hypothetical protein
MRGGCAWFCAHCIQISLLNVCRTTYNCIILPRFTPISIRALAVHSPQALSHKLRPACLGSSCELHRRFLVSMETDDAAATRRPVAQPDATAATSSAKNEFMPWVRSCDLPRE